MREAQEAGAFADLTTQSSMGGKTFSFQHTMGEDLQELAEEFCSQYPEDGCIETVVAALRGGELEHLCKLDKKRVGEGLRD